MRVRDLCKQLFMSRSHSEFLQVLRKQLLTWCMTFFSIKWGRFYRKTTKRTFKRFCRRTWGRRRDSTVSTVVEVASWGHLHLHGHLLNSLRRWRHVLFVLGAAFGHLRIQTAIERPFRVLHVHHPNARLRRCVAQLCNASHVKHGGGGRELDGNIVTFHWLRPVEVFVRVATLECSTAFDRVGGVSKKGVLSCQSKHKSNRYDFSVAHHQLRRTTENNQIFLWKITFIHLQCTLLGEN